MLITASNSCQRSPIKAKKITLSQTNNSSIINRILVLRQQFNSHLEFKSIAYSLHYTAPPLLHCTHYTALYSLHCTVITTPHCTHYTALPTTLHCTRYTAPPLLLHCTVLTMLHHHYSTALYSLHCMLRSSFNQRKKIL